jgi:hypothetical protein
MGGVAVRTVPAALRAAMLASQTSEVLLTFLTITHTDLVSPIRVVNNNEDVVRDTYTFTRFPFRIVLPVDKNGEIGAATLTISAVDRAITTAIRSINTPAEVTIAVALASDPSNAELEMGTFEWRGIAYDADSVTGELVYADKFDTELSALTFNSIDFPGAM